jgi:hypothetical protein
MKGPDLIQIVRAGGSVGYKEIQVSDPHSIETRAPFLVVCGISLCRRSSRLSKSPGTGRLITQSITWGDTKRMFISTLYPDLEIFTHEEWHRSIDEIVICK